MTSTGNITTGGSLASGIVAETGNGAATVTSTGNITTAGSFSSGINAKTGTGAVTVTSTGNIAPRAPRRTGSWPPARLAR